MVTNCNIIKISTFLSVLFLVLHGTNLYADSLPGAKKNVELKFSKPKISGNLFCVPIGQIQKMFKNTVNSSMSHLDLPLGELKNIQEVVAKNPDDLDSRITLGLIYGNREEYSKAQKEFDFILSKDPENLVALYSLGLIHQINRNSKEALKFFTKVTELDNANADAYYNRGMIEYSRFEKADALVSLQKAVELDNSLIEAHYNLGVMHGAEAHGIALQGHVGGGYDESEYANYLNEAVQEFKAALRTKPDHFGALYNLGLSYLFLEKFDQAFTVADYLEEINPFLGQQLRFRVENPVATH